MRRTAPGIAVLLLTVAALPTIATAENWPGWRGPLGDGRSRTDAPLHWDGRSSENIRWKTELAGEGHSSPVVWEDRLFLTSCLPESLQRVLICYDAQTGRKRWQQTVITSPLETKHALNSRASSTPATDGRLVFVTFLEVDGSTIPAPNVGNVRPVTPGQMVVAAYDFEGRQQWLVRPGSFVSAHGFCSNPVLYRDLVIVNGDHDGDSYLVALDKKTGKTVWKTAREHKTRSYTTPLVRNVDGQDELVLSGSLCIAGFDPKSGKRLWKIDGPTEQFVASMVDDGELFYMAAGFPTYHVMAVRPGGRGNVTESHVAWHVTNARCYVPSPVVVGNYLLVADDRGTANCFDKSSGERLWQERLGKHFSASLVAADGLVYFIADDGVTKIVRPAAELEVVAENELGENCYASPAIADGRLYVRGQRHLFCIGERPVASGE